MCFDVIHVHQMLQTVINVTVKWERLAHLVEMISGSNSAALRHISISCIMETVIIYLWEFVWGIKGNVSEDTL